MQPPKHALHQKQKLAQKIETEHTGLTFEVIELEDIKTNHPTDQKQVRRGVYLVPNLITALSMLAAFFSIISSSNHAFDKAAMAVFLSAILDGMDGRAARMLGAQSPFGEQLDSLADMIAFGLAPAVLVYHFALAPLGRLGMACAFVFLACAAFRLARFNVQIGVVDKKYFIGLASPLAALLVASAVLVGADYEAQSLPFLYAIWTVVCGLLMVSNLKYYSFKEFDKKKVPFVVLILGVLVMGLVLYDIPMGVLTIGCLYVLSGMIGTLKAKQ